MCLPIVNVSSIYTVSQKKCAKLFLTELCQMSINFNNFWQVDEKMSKLIQKHFPPHLTHVIAIPC